MKGVAPYPTLPYPLLSDEPARCSLLTVSRIGCPGLLLRCCRVSRRLALRRYAFRPRLRG
jgi:hypothetical protein